MTDILNTDTESADINEAWVREHFNLAKERKTTYRAIGQSMDIDEQPYGFAPVEYDRFFDILKNQVDAHILHLIVKNNVTCAEKFIKIQLEMTTNNWYGEGEAAVYISMEWRQRETNKEVIKRLISTNKRKLTSMKRKAKTQNKLANQIKNMSDTDRQALKELL